MKKGIVIYAIGHPFYYAMAENLATSLIVNGSKKSEISICAICDDKKKFVNPQLFDDFVVLTDDQYKRSGKVVFNDATISVFDLSPYDITIKLDADIIGLPGKNFADLFDQLKDENIAIMNRGYGDLLEDRNFQGYSVWAVESDIKKTHKLDDDSKCYKIYGEFLYFNKSKESEKFFGMVKSIYKKSKVKCNAFSNGNFTDELAFQIACMVLKQYPHKDNFTPILNKYLDLRQYVGLQPYQLPATFYGYSIGGNSISGFSKKQYNSLANHYFAQMGLSHPFHAIDKRHFLQERIKL